MMAKMVKWEGTATQLLLELEANTIPQTVKSRGWPADHKGLSGRLRRNTEMLRKRGIELKFNRRGRGRNRTITIRRVIVSKSAETTSASSASSADTAQDNENNDIDANGTGRRRPPALRNVLIHRLQRGHHRAERTLRTIRPNQRRQRRTHHRPQLTS